MNCLEDESKISAWIDGELSEGEASDVERHLSSCSSCKALADSLQETSRALARIQRGEISPDPGFLVRFRVRRDELSVAPWWTWRELALRLLPLAALVLVAALLSVHFSSNDERNLEALELEALGTEAGFSATSAGEPVLSIALEPFPPER
jgi:anti-sigma factor RsiW